MKLKCLKCGYEWISRLEGRPKACPECKNRKWDVPKRGDGQLKGMNEIFKKECS